MANLYKAFVTVRSNVNASGRTEFKAQVQKISENPFPYLKRIQTELQKGRFVFRPRHGVHEGEIKEWLYIFPLTDIGVPQGSFLSAFAGNVVLRDFDQRLNGRNIKTIRHVDDFVILGRSEQAVRAAFHSASSILNGLGTTAHGPDEHTDKSKVGQVSDGFAFLGRSIKANKVSPSRKSTDSFLRDIRRTLNVGSQAIRKYACADTERRVDETFVQVVARVDRKIRGWGDAFSLANNRLPFRQLNAKISQLLKEFFEGRGS